LPTGASRGCYGHRGLEPKRAIASGATVKAAAVCMLAEEICRALMRAKCVTAGGGIVMQMSILSTITTIPQQGEFRVPG